MSDKCCDTAIEFADLERDQRRVLTRVLVINVLAFAVMVGGSLLSGS